MRSPVAWKHSRNWYAQKRYSLGSLWAGVRAQSVQAVSWFLWLELRTGVAWDTVEVYELMSSIKREWDRTSDAISRVARTRGYRFYVNRCSCRTTWPWILLCAWPPRPVGSNSNRRLAALAVLEAGDRSIQGVSIVQAV